MGGCLYVNKTRGDFDTRGKAKLNKLTDSRGLSDEMATCTREKRLKGGNLSKEARTSDAIQWCEWRLVQRTNRHPICRQLKGYQWRRESDEWDRKKGEVSCHGRSNCFINRQSNNGMRCGANWVAETWSYGKMRRETWNLSALKWKLMNRLVESHCFHRSPTEMSDELIPTRGYKPSKLPIIRNVVQSSLWVFENSWMEGRAWLEKSRLC
jgi:hypothetical protein